MENIHFLQESTRDLLPLTTDLQNTCISRILPPVVSKIPIELAQKVLKIEYSDYFEEYLIFTEDYLYKGISTPEVLLEFPEMITCGRISPSGEYAFISGKATNCIITLDTKEVIYLDEDPEFDTVLAAFRYDSQFIAIADPNQLRTYKRTGGLEGTIDIEEIKDMTWNSAGSWIAVAHGNTITFLEKNCRERQSIELPNQLICVSWSFDLDILAAMDDQFNIYILSHKNRVFYRKLDFKLNVKELQPSIFWGRHLNFSVVDSDGLIHDIYLNKYVDSTEKSVYVINGNALCISNWSKALIPPPLFHEKIEYEDQIVCVAADSNHLAIFTKTHIHIDEKQYEAPVPYYTACWRNDVLHFASGNTIFAFEDGKIVEKNTEEYPVNFITPSFTVCNMSLINGIVDLQGITTFIENDGKFAAMCSTGKLYLNNNNPVTTSASSFLYTERLFAYIDNASTLHINYDDQSTEHQTELQARLLFFSKHIHSVVIQMQRGNTETLAPHIVVESALRDLLAQHLYSDAIRVSKRYQINFTRLIQLGEIDIEKFLQNAADGQLHQLFSSLTPFKVENDMKFVLNFLGYVLGGEVTYDEAEQNVVHQPFDPERELSKKYATSVCLSFLLLNLPAKAIQFACSFTESQTAKSVINFLLTMYDPEQLYDLSMKTYDVDCIASVALVIMKEPSSYIGWIEELKNCSETLRIAKIDEHLGDHKNAVKYYAQCGPEWEELCLSIIRREKLYNEGINAYKPGTPIWMNIINMKLEELSKEEKNNQEVAATAIRSNDGEIVLKYVKQIARAGLFRLALKIIPDGKHDQLKEALEKEKAYNDAGYVAAQYCHDNKEAIRLFMLAHKWYKAIENGATEEDVANESFEMLKVEFQKIENDAAKLKEKYQDILSKQKDHPESTKRAKNKDKRGLPAIVARLETLLPSNQRKHEVEQVVALLTNLNQLDKVETLRRAFRAACRAVWPIPHLPDTEDMMPPPYLKGIL